MPDQSPANATRSHGHLPGFPALIPAPNKMELGQGIVRFAQNAIVHHDSGHPELLLAVDYLKNWLAGHAAPSPVKTEPVPVHLSLEPRLPAEGYQLEARPARIHIQGGNGAGVFYGIQTLIQLTRPWECRLRSGPCCFPEVTIEDQPAFSYRGMHLDVGRHLYPVTFIKQFIDLLARYKMNTFHWHLTEDQGWRIEIKRYPRLQEISAYRSETLIGHLDDQPPKKDGTPYGGYYTQDEVREVVEYARRRAVTIIPEIELPGHAQAAIAAYPELGCLEKNLQVATSWGIFENVFCPSEKTFAFLENVLTEIMDLFPGPYIHIGGDECPKEQWKASRFCQQVIRENGLKDEFELQSWFIRRIEKFLNQHGKRLIGWDEILEGGLAPNATVMSWRGEDGGIEAARMGHDVVMTPTEYCYFDTYQSGPEGEPLAIGGLLPLEKVYSYHPVPRSLDPDKAHHVLGAQGNVWTEYMKSPEQVEYMVYPRMLALAEVVWKNGRKRDFRGFRSRLQHHVCWLTEEGVNVAPHV